MYTNCFEQKEKYFHSFTRAYVIKSNHVKMIKVFVFTKKITLAFNKFPFNFHFPAPSVLLIAMCIVHCAGIDIVLRWVAQTV